jgi:4-amino-4-deoxy-L-arabinose transferase-like glycosyltransferase
MPFLSVRPHAPIQWPTALIPSVKLLWQRTLFPGRIEIDPRIRVLSLLVLLIVPAAVIYPCLKFHLLEPDEGRYAQIPREMLLRGDWIVPHAQGEPYLDKPPLMYWLIMLSYSVFGIHDWAARLVPALVVHGTILTTYLIGRNRLGERPAFLGALLLSLSPGLVSMGRLLILDGLLTFWVTLGLLAGWMALPRRVEERDETTRARGWWIVCSLATALGVLTKGPVAVLLVVPPLVLHRWLFGLTWADRGRRPWWTFALIVIGLNLPWYVAIVFLRPEFGGHFFLEHNFLRFVAPFNHIEPIWYYVPILIGFLLPGTLLLWPIVRDLISGESAVASRRCPDFGFALLAGGWCVLFFSLSGSKLPTYIQPAFPILGLALGYYWADWQQRTTKFFRRWFASCCVVTFALMVFAHYVALPWYAEHRSPMGAPAAELRAAFAEPNTAVACFPRGCDSAAFYLGRDDFRPTRSKFVHLLIADLLTRERTVVLFTHRHSYELLKDVLPPELTIEHAATFRRQLPGPSWITKLVGDAPWGLCDLAIIRCSRPRPATE